MGLGSQHLSRGFELTIKRAVDVLAAAAGLLLLSPSLGLIVLAIWADSGRPAMFRQVRLGIAAKPFVMWKFRTMYAQRPETRNPDGSSFVGRGDPRITRVGRWLREFGLDELPQLFNVLKGEMSLVGPRTIQPDQLDTLSERDQSIFFRMRPGITSLAQVSGRNELPWSKRAKLEVYYVTHYSLWIDLQILLRTIPTGLLRTGVYNPDLPDCQQGDP